MKILNLEKQTIPLIESSITRKRVLKENYQENYQELYEFLKKFKDKDNQILMSITLPVFNEQNIIYSVLNNLPKNELIEIIVVDDHSSDNSVKEIEKIRNEKQIRLIKHKINKGYGGAIKTGVKAAKGKVIITMDSDGQHSPLDILSLVKPIFEGEADFAIGSRYLGANYYDLPLVTRLGEAILEKVLQILFNIKIMNNQNGFRAFNKKIVPLFDDTKFQGFTFATELILKTSLNGYKIKECPIKLYHRQFGSSKINLTTLTLDLISCIFLHYLKKIKMLLFKRKNSEFRRNA